MSVKQVFIPELGKVSLYKRKGTSSMRLSIGHDGQVKLSMPKWAPYSAGITFVNKNRDWITKHQVDKMPEFTNNLRIGKAHTLHFITDTSIDKISTRLIQGDINLYLPPNYTYSSEPAQDAAKKAAHRALKKQAEQLLPQRLDTLAKQYGFDYSSVKIKQLKSRWGSCNNLKQITLSFYLMQLPWELIDYVILHELTHTKVLAHGKNFWDELNKYLPNAKELRKQINQYKPVINTTL